MPGRGSRCSPRSDDGAARATTGFRRTRRASLVPSTSSTACAPSRIVPPRSSISFCSGRRSITGYGVSGSISVEFAPARPTTWRANSEIATCMPRQMPRYGIPRSRATRQARIFPSQPREPKPPGIEDAVDLPSSSASASSSDIPSASSQRTVHAAAVVDARVLQRLVHGEVRVLKLHVLADERDLDRPLELAERVRSAPTTRRARPAAAGSPSSRDDQLVQPFRLQLLRHEVDVRHVAVHDHRAAARCPRRGRSCRASPRQALARSGRRRCPGGYRCGEARSPSAGSASSSARRPPR